MFVSGPVLLIHLSRMFMFHVDATTLATAVIEANGDPKRKNPKHTAGLSLVLRSCTFSVFTLHTPPLPTEGSWSRISQLPVDTPHHAVALMAE